MNITMTLGEVDCHAQILENEITCRIPKDLIIPAEGVPVRVRNLNPLTVCDLRPHATEARIKPIIATLTNKINIIKKSCAVY